MLATSYFAPSSSPHQFLPAIPSPLSPRSANIHGRHPARDNSMSEPQKKLDAVSSSSVPFSKRPVKKAPSPSQNELKDRRRANFLRKVRDKREDKRFEARGEDVMRLDFMQRKRAYERELARSAPLEPVDEEEEYELPGWSQQGSQMQLSSQQEEADEFERDEEGELMALLEYMPTGEQENSWNMPVEQQRDDTNLWSDDADYDALFSEVLGQESSDPQCGSQVRQQDGEGMDMS